MADVFQKIFNRTTQKNCYQSDKSSYSYNILNQRLKNIIFFLKIEKIKKQRIAILLDQGFDYGSVLTAIPLSQNVAVPLSKSWKSFENEKVINFLECGYIITDLSKINDLKVKFVCTFHNLFLFKTNVKNISISKNSDAIILLSSGTTGNPKGVVLTKNSITNNVNGVIKYLKLKENDRSLIHTPTCYAFSVSQTLTHLMAGACLYPFSKIIFPGEILKVIKKNYLTGLTGPPASFKILIDIANNKFPSIRYCQVGGTPFSLDLAIKIRKIFPNSKILNVYGCSENSPRVSFFYLKKKLTKGLDKNGYYCVGRAVAGTKIKIFNKTKKSKEGEILIKGNSLMSRYWKNQILTKKKIINGYFNTGDIGYIFKKNLYLSGRKDFIINMGNQKIMPDEVENVLNKHPMIKDSVVYKIADRDNMLGSIPVANIVLKKKLDINLIFEFCSRYLSNYKIPKKFFLVSKIKKNLYGKIERRYYNARFKK